MKLKVGEAYLWHRSEELWWYVGPNMIDEYYFLQSKNGKEIVSIDTAKNYNSIMQNELGRLSKWATDGLENGKFKHIPKKNIKKYLKCKNGKLKN